MSLGSRISERLQVLGIKQAELIRRSGLPQSTVNSIINKDRRSSPHLIRIARALQTTPAYLAGEVDDPDLDVPLFQFTGEEEQLVEHVRALDPHDRKAVLTLIESLYRCVQNPAGATVHDERLVYRGQAPQGDRLLPAGADLRSKG